MKDNDSLFDFDIDIDEAGNYETIGNWAIKGLHVLKFAFVVYSGAHNISAAIVGAGGEAWQLIAQIIGVLILESTILGIYMAFVAGKLTGDMQRILAIALWVVGMIMATMGIVADSQLHAGYALSRPLVWHLQTGLFVAPAVMILGIALVVITDPVLLQNIRASVLKTKAKEAKIKAVADAQMQKLKASMMAQQVKLDAVMKTAEHHRRYYESDAFQADLDKHSLGNFIANMRDSGVYLTEFTQDQPEEVTAFAAESTPPQPAIVETTVEPGAEAQPEKDVNFTPPQPQK